VLAAAAAAAAVTLALTGRLLRATPVA